MRIGLKTNIKHYRLKTVFRLMLSMVLPDALKLPLQIFIIIMHEEILHILASVLKNYIA